MRLLAIPWMSGVPKLKYGKSRQPTKEQIAIRFSPEVLAASRASGKGWQTRMDEALKEWL
jgi:uncharacterized protein (DUF4415 family)